MVDREILSLEASTHTSNPYQDGLHPFVPAVAQSANDNENPLQYNADNRQNAQTSSLSSHKKAPFASAFSPAVRNKEDSQSLSDSVHLRVDHHRDAPTGETALYNHPYSAPSADQSAETISSSQTSARSRIPHQNELDNAPTPDAQLTSQGRIPSVDYALDQSPKTKIPQASLRSKFSRLFGSRRKPREERPKSLNRLPLNPQVEGITNHLQIPSAALTSQIQHRQTIRHSVSAPAISRPSQLGPRFIGLQDRLAKEPIAVPTSVRRVDFQLPTDQTIATRGNSSGALNMGYVPLGNESVENRWMGSHFDSQASIRALPGDKQRRSIWARIKGKAKKVFGRGTPV
ncbi:MAG: hypothetical protein LQ343_006849 [Gyalolechia ehrenbergii]|nr:MAG: hypothetical protein LQ343_006849 [Gyalolechia ehrenbergii]